MNEGSRNFWVGMFVLASLIVLATLMVWFGEVPDWLRVSEWTLRITGMREVTGISEGSAVSLNGVEIGRVHAIGFADPRNPNQGVVVYAGIQRDVVIPSGAVAHLYGATLGFGRGNINIVVQPGAVGSPLPQRDAEIRGVTKSMLNELISREALNTLEQTVANIGALADAATPLARNLAELLEKRSVADVEAPEVGLAPNISTVVERIDRLAANLNAVIGDENVQTDVKAAVTELKEATMRLKETIALWNSESKRLADNLNDGIDGAEERLDESFAGLNQVLEYLDDASKSLVAALHNIEEGRGTVGLMVRDERLYEAAVLAVQRFSAVMGNLEAITGKIRDDGYITVGQAPTGLLKKRIPVGAQAARSE